MRNQQLTSFGVTSTPWHGKRVEGVTSMKEAMENAGLDFQVETVPMLMKSNSLTDEAVESLLLEHKPQTPEDYRMMIQSAINGCFKMVKDRLVIRRENDHNVYGVCKNRWQPLQNVDAFEWFQPALDSGLVKLSTVGSLQQGRKIWIMAELDEPPVEIVKGDEIAKYVLLCNGHDGGTALSIGFTPIRIFCANQFPALKRNKATQLIRFRHSQHTKLQLDKIRDIMSFANAEFNATAEQYRELCKHAINKNDLEKYVKLLFCDKSEQSKPLADIPTRKRNQLQEIIELAETGIGLQVEGIRGTYYAAFNAVNQHLNYDAGRNVDNRMNSLWFGQNKTLNERALELATSMALAS